LRVGVYVGEVGVYVGEVGVYVGEVGVYVGEVGAGVGEVGVHVGEVGAGVGEEVAVPKVYEGDPKSSMGARQIGQVGFTLSQFLTHRLWNR
jgi:hypothetical protein